MPFMFWVSCSYRNDFAFIGLSDHSCGFPNLQTEHKAERKVKGPLCIVPHQVDASCFDINLIFSPLRGASHISSLSVSSVFHS